MCALDVKSACKPLQHHACGREPLAYKEFMLRLADDVTPEDAQREYRRYLAEYWGSQTRAEFQAKHKEPWCAPGAPFSPRRNARKCAGRPAFPAGQARLGMPSANQGCRCFCIWAVTAQQVVLIIKSTMLLNAVPNISKVGIQALAAASCTACQPRMQNAGQHSQAGV